MAKVYLALGSNVGDSVTLIKNAVEELKAALSNIAVAPIYVSKAVGYTEQPDFYNTALRADTELSPEQLLAFVKKVEKKVGRIYRFRWGPREIDIDIIFYGDLVMETPELTIPHPRFAERDFVLQPIADINSGYIDPRSGHTVAALLEQLSDDQQAVLKRI